MKLDAQKLGQRIRSARKKKMWRQDDLAERIGKSTTYVGMIERGERLPALDTFVDILVALDITADQVLCDVPRYGLHVRLLQYERKICELSQKEKERLYEIIDVYLDK